MVAGSPINEEILERTSQTYLGLETEKVNNIKEISWLSGLSLVLSQGELFSCNRHGMQQHFVWLAQNIKHIIH